MNNMKNPKFNLDADTCTWTRPSRPVGLAEGTGVLLPDIRLKPDPSGRLAPSGSRPERGTSAVRPEQGASENADFR